MRHLFLVLLAAAALCITGCTQAQIDRAAQISAEADARLVQADQAMALAQQAVDQGKVLAEQLGSVRAEQVISQAQQALVAAGAAREAAKVASDTGHLALTAAQRAQAAGGSTLDVLIAVATTAAPSLGALFLALRKLWDVGKAFRQTVAGVEKAKETMPADQVAKLHAALAAEQDQQVKDRVSLVKAALPALLLGLLFLGGAPASELGLGPSPSAGSGTVNSAAITDGSIVDADVNASAALAGTKVAPAFGAQNISSTNTGAASFTTAGGYTSTVATGTAPFTATSTTACPNLNASQLLGGTWAAPGTIGSGTPSSGAFSTLSASGAITSTLATGTAPFTVASTTVVGNLNASQLLGATWASPSAIGTGTPAAGTFTTVTGSGLVTGQTLKGTGYTSTRVPYFTTAGLITDSANMTFDGTNTFTVGAHGVVGIVTTSALFTESTFSANGNAGLLVATVGDSYLNGASGRSVFLRIAGTPVISCTGTLITIDDPVSVTSATDSTSPTTGSMITAGGLGVVKNVVTKAGHGYGCTTTATAAGTTALAASSQVVQVFTGVTTQTMTLPAANAYGAGVAVTYMVKNLSTGLVTVQRAGSDTINSTASNVTSFTLAQWASCILVSDGVSAWQRF